MMKHYKLFLDSGAFSAYANKSTIDIGEYIEFIKEHKDQIEVYANLDDIGDPRKTWSNQRRMEREGLNPIPVYHLSEPDRYLMDAMEYPYFAVGGVASAKGAGLRPFLNSIFRMICTEETNFLPTHRVHGFGIATPEIICDYPWYSLDSTSWVMYGRYGIVLVPDDKLGYLDYTKPPYAISISSRSKASEDFKLFNTLAKERKEWMIKYFLSKGCPMGKTLTKQVKPGYVLKENEKWVDRKTKEGVEETALEKAIRAGQPKTEEDEKTVRVEVFKEKGLCCDGEMRDRLNLIYFLDMERNQRKYPWPWYGNVDTLHNGKKVEEIVKSDIIVERKDLFTLYLSGNFPQLSKIEKEQAMADFLVANGYSYHRLMTFYYKKDCHTIMTVAKNLEEEKK